jgi:NTP pyrophosphatase (non-canonical NTP hydrolase)
MIPAPLLPRAQSACAAAVKTWGQEPQFRIAQEELCELAAAISRLLRGRPEGWEQACEEAADVALCLLQLRIMLGSEVDRMIELKLARLEARVADAKGAE